MISFRNLRRKSPRRTVIVSLVSSSTSSGLLTKRDGGKALPEMSATASPGLVFSTTKPSLFPSCSSVLSLELSIFCKRQQLRVL